MAIAWAIVLQYGGLARLGRGDDEAALGPCRSAERNQVDDPRRGRRVAVLETEPLAGV